MKLSGQALRRCRPAVGAGPWPAQLLLVPAQASDPMAAQEQDPALVAPIVTSTGPSSSTSGLPQWKKQLEIKVIWSRLLILEVEPATGGTRALILPGCDLRPLQILRVLLQGSAEDTWNEFDIVPGVGAGSLAWVPEGRGWAGPCTTTHFLCPMVKFPSLFQQWGNTQRS